MNKTLAALGAVVVLTAGAMVAGVPAGAAACSRYEAVASADGVRTAAASPGFLLVEEADAGAPAAQARVDSAGVSLAYAGYPYPGDAALSALPLAGVPRNQYPLTVESSYPASSEAELDATALALSAKSEERASSAMARAGAAPDDGTSIGLTAAKTDVSCGDDGTVTAVGESTAEALSFGGVLRIGRIHSTAKVVVGTDGEPSEESDLEVTQITVAGQTVGLSDEGLVLGESATPLPDNPLAEVLAEAGIGVTYVAPSEKAGQRGVSAPVLQIELAREAVGSGATVVTYTFGRAFASATSSGSGSDVLDGAIGGETMVGPDSPPTTSPPAQSGSSLAAEPVSNSGSAAEAGAEPLPTSGGNDLEAPAPDQPAAAADDGSDESTAEVALGRTSSTGVVTGFSSMSVYVVMIAGAVALLAGALLLRMLGVKLGWT